MSWLRPRLIGVSILACLAASCGTWNPAAERLPENAPPPAARGGVTATFLGNTTLLVSDGRTRLLIDGFVTRPGAIRTLAGKIGPDENEIRRWLGPDQIGRVDAILVGHAHHDHSLDAPTLSRLHDAPVYGSRAYGYIHEGHLGQAGRTRLHVITGNRESYSIGNFRVTFCESGHVATHNFLQRAVDGPINAPVPPRAHYTRYRCGDVYALHLAHPGGSIAITTSAGTAPAQFAGLRADALFLGIGMLPEQDREAYWRETVGVLEPDVVVPIHWDDFTRPLDRGLRSRPRWQEDLRETFRWLRERPAGRKLVILDAHEKLTLPL
jgi:L-ascorbate metabolism protein UlaG (beta-lactamase superfamily)